MKSAYYSVVKQALEAVRDTILAEYGSASFKEKEDRTIVTAIDTTVEQRISERLRAAYPNIGVHGEEFGRRGKSDTYWLIDPIDGTESFMRGLPGVTTIIGLVQGDEVREAYVYDPIDNALYFASKGQGAFCNEQPITVSSRPVSRSIVSLSSNAAQVPEMAFSLQDAGVFFVGSYIGSGVKSIYVASGKIDGSGVFGGGGPWDYAPTRLLMEEAGAIITYFDDPGITSRKYCVFTPANSEVLTQKVKGCFERYT